MRRLDEGSNCFYNVLPGIHVSIWSRSEQLARKPVPPQRSASHSAGWCILLGAQPVLFCVIMTPDFELAAAIVLTSADPLMYCHIAMCCTGDGSGAC